MIAYRNCSNCHGEVGKNDITCPHCGVLFSNVSRICINCGYIGTMSTFVFQSGVEGTGLCCPKCSWPIERYKVSKEVVCPNCHSSVPTLERATVGELRVLNVRNHLLVCPHCDIKFKVGLTGEVRIVRDPIGEANNVAIASIIFGSIGILTSWLSILTSTSGFIVSLSVSVVGEVLALVSLERIKGNRLAIAGLVLCIIGAVAAITFVVLANLPH